MGTIPEDKVTDEEVAAAELNLLRDIGFANNETAGEVINGATLPVACFNDESDNEWYACDGNDSTKVDFQGFAITNGTDGNDIVIQTSGVVSGFAGLTPGAKYYVKNDQTLGTTEGSFNVIVGIAISATQIFLITSNLLRKASAYFVSDILKVFADTEVTSTINSYAKKKEIRVSRGGAIRMKFDMKHDGGAASDDAYGRIYINDVAVGTEQARQQDEGGFATFSEDIEVDPYDRVQLYLREDGTGTARAENFRFYYNLAPIDDADVIIDA